MTLPNVVYVRLQENGAIVEASYPGRINNKIYVIESGNCFAERLGLLTLKAFGVESEEKD